MYVKVLVQVTEAHEVEEIFHSSASQTQITHSICLHPRFCSYKVMLLSNASSETAKSLAWQHWSALVLLRWQEFATRSVAVFFLHATTVAVANIGQCQG